MRSIALKLCDVTDDEDDLILCVTLDVVVVRDHGMYCFYLLNKKCSWQIVLNIS